MRKTLLLFYLVVSFSACDFAMDKVDNRLKINNSTDDTVVFISGHDLPDSSIMFTYCMGTDREYLIYPQDLGTYTNRGTWENDINESLNKRIIIYVLKMDTVRKYLLPNRNCDSLQKKERIAKRFEVTLDYLNSHDWKLQYP